MDNDTSILLRLTAELKRDVEAAAKRDHRSVQQELRLWIERALAAPDNGGKMVQDASAR